MLQTRKALRPPLAVLLAAAAALSACAVGPNYRRPTAPLAAGFKEAQGWRPAAPMDHIDRGAWWSVYNDPVLDGLERRVALSNQNVAAAEAAYREAQAITRQARASLFPTLGLTASATRSRSGGGSVSTGAGGSSGAGATLSSGARERTVYDLGLGASWEPDLWGRIRRTIEADRASAQASAAEVASARLSAQAALAIDYFELRISDALKRLYDQTVADYQRTLQIAQNQFKAGVIARADVITAQVQLQAAQAAAADLAVARQQYEHAIAVLVGAPPSALSIAPTSETVPVPVAPVDLPSTLLERRPDIASAERRVASANAQIGVATAAYFPMLTLSANAGTSATRIGDLFKSSTTTWSFGPSLAESLIDFGARRARVQQARALYDQAVASYRQTVLGAFQAVEDSLVTLRVLEQEAQLRSAAEASARQSAQIALNQYRAGLVDFTTVVTANQSALSTAETSLNVLRSRLVASVNLIEALGGGWTVADLPKG